jgi:NADH-quinone oxidoreductase subunit G
VGALTAKPSRFAGRAWEMIQHPGVAPHDSVGSNIYVHTLRGKVIRVVPRDNEAINEVWISDRDRFSYQGLFANDRISVPMVKQDGEWRETDWDEALQVAANGLQAVIKSNGADQFAAWTSPSATLEELYVLQKLVRGVGSANIDHRLRQSDFTDQDTAPVMPWLGQNIEDLENLDAALLIGSHVRKDQPLIAHRLRKAAVHNAAKISFVNTREFDWHFPVAHQCVASASGMLDDLAAIAKSAFELSGESVPAHLAGVINAAVITDVHKQIAEDLKQAEKATVLLGNMAIQHPQLSVLRKLADAIAKQTGNVLGYLPEQANTAGAWLAGAVPHRGPAGSSVENKGKTATEMQADACKAVLTFNIEPEFDAVNGARALEAVRRAECVVSISSYFTESMKEYADVILPLAAFTETSGTYVNAEGFWQSFKGVTAPLGEARPGWKILRVMGNLFNLDGFEYVSSEDIKDELKQQCQDIELDNTVTCTDALSIEKTTGLQRIGDIPLYSVDTLVRRATALQKTKDAEQECVRVSSKQAEASGVAEAEKIKVSQDNGHAYLPLVIDDSIPEGCVWISAGTKGSASLGELYGPVELEKV